jgi:anaerobic selenocysteine-containing dehydrogenase
MHVGVSSMTDSPSRIRTRAMCRTCMVSCGVFLEIEDGRVVSLIGDKDDPASHGWPSTSSSTTRACTSGTRATTSR